jgi:hypothetical protein
MTAATKVICALPDFLRASKFFLYVMMNAEDNQDLVSKLGKHKTGKACLYVKRLVDIDTKVFETLIKRTIDQVKKKYPESKNR